MDLSASNPLPFIETTGEELLSSGEYQVLEIDESKAVSVGVGIGNVYVVERKDKPGKQFAHLKFISAKDLKIRPPHPQHPMFHIHKNHHRDMESNQAGECK
jgi:hypothetical protein